MTVLAGKTLTRLWPQFEAGVQWVAAQVCEGWRGRAGPAAESKQRERVEGEGGPGETQQTGQWENS